MTRFLPVTQHGWGAEYTDAQFTIQCLDTGKDFAFPKDYTSSAISVGFGEALLRLLGSLTEPLIPTSLNAACGTATSKDEGFEVSKVFSPSPVHGSSRRRSRRAKAQP
jgi:hypothetical protein